MNDFGVEIGNESRERILNNVIDINRGNKRKSACR
jgi:hypothetical protein